MSLEPHCDAPSEVNGMLDCKIPLEVCEQIIDCVAEEPLPAPIDSFFFRTLLRTLASCALTCRSWCPRARYHRMSHVFVNSLSQLDHRLPSTRRPQRTPQSPFPLRSLVLDVVGPDIRSWVSCVPVRLTTRKTGIESVYIFDLDCYVIHTTFWPLLSLNRFGVTTLILVNISLPTFIQLRSVINRFPKLSYLAVMTVSVKESGDSLAPIGPPVTIDPSVQRLQLKTLRLRWVFTIMDDLVRWFVRINALTGLETLRFEGSYWPESTFEGVSSAIGACKGTLRSLWLHSDVLPAFFAAGKIVEEGGVGESSAEKGKCMCD